MRLKILAAIFGATGLSAAGMGLYRKYHPSTVARAGGATATVSPGASGAEPPVATALPYRTGRVARKGAATEARYDAGMVRWIPIVVPLFAFLLAIGVYTIFAAVM